MGVVISQYDVYLINLDPTAGLVIPCHYNYGGLQRKNANLAGEVV